MEEYKLFALIALALKHNIGVETYMPIFQKMTGEFSLLSYDFLSLTRLKGILNLSDFIKHFEDYYKDICEAQDYSLVETVYEIKKQFKIHRKLSKSTIHNTIRQELVNFLYTQIPKINYDNESTIESKEVGIKKMEEYLALIQELQNEEDFNTVSRLNIADETAVSSYETLQATINAEQQFSIRTGIPTLDKYLKGGLKNARIGLIFALPKRFKTTMALNLAIRAFAGGYNVVFISLEMNLEDAKAKISQIKSLQSMWRLREKKQYNNFFEIVYRPPHSFSTDDLQRYLNELVREGKRPNLILIDYVDIMRNPDLGRGAEKRHMLNSLYYKLRGIVNKYNISLWTISQANRQATQSTKTKTEHIAEDFSKVAGVDYLISLSQQRLQKKQGFVTMSFLESRWTDWTDLDADDIVLYRKNGSLIFKELTPESTDLVQYTDSNAAPAKLTKAEKQEQNRGRLQKLIDKKRGEPA